jgi:hypothetical protein
MQIINQRSKLPSLQIKTWRGALRASFSYNGGSFPLLIMSIAPHWGYSRETAQSGKTHMSWPLWRLILGYVAVLYLILLPIIHWALKMPDSNLKITVHKMERDEEGHY